MFNFNFPAGIYGSSGISFESEPAGASDVTGAATATLPTALMYIFGTDQFALTANCTARLEISTVDVMLVLDVTGRWEERRVGREGVSTCGSGWGTVNEQKTTH